MSTSNQYFSNIPACRYVFKSGTVAEFMNGKYLTSSPKEIEELEEEIKQGHPHLYIKKGHETADNDPLAGLKQKIINDYIAGQKKAMEEATDGSRDFGSTVSAASIAEQIKPASSVKVASVAGKSNSK